eukprot:7363205-Alexandrium_andersonii.AAC.1
MPVAWVGGPALLSPRLPVVRSGGAGSAVRGLLTGAHGDSRSVEAAGSRLGRGPLPRTGHRRGRSPAPCRLHRPRCVPHRHPLRALPLFRHGLRCSPRARSMFLLRLTGIRYSARGSRATVASRQTARLVLS